jgi:hypothetical protein
VEAGSESGKIARPELFRNATHRGSPHATVSKPADPSRQVTPLGEESSPNVAPRRHFVNLAR